MGGTRGRDEGWNGWGQGEGTRGGKGIGTGGRDEVLAAYKPPIGTKHFTNSQILCKLPLPCCTQIRSHRTNQGESQSDYSCYLLFKNTDSERDDKGPGSDQQTTLVI